MASLGSFGAAMRELDPAAERDTFQFFGEPYTVVGEIPPMLMLQLGAATSGKIDDSEGMAAMWEALRCSLDEPDREPGQPAPVKQFDRLYKVAVKQRAEMESLMRLVFALFEVQGGRPTAAAPVSSGGPQTTSPSSNTSSSASPVSPAWSPEPTEQQRDQDDRRHLVPVRDLLTG